MECILVTTESHCMALCIGMDEPIYVLKRELMFRWIVRGQEWEQEDELQSWSSRGKKR